ncbi:MAG: acylphosphatase [Terriglobales bacterium]
MPQAMHFTVWGQVQGVGYRAFAARQAAALGLRGWVRNRADGAVEGLAIGAAEPLAAFQRALARGPAAARVERVQMTPATLEPRDMTEAAGFRIETDGYG